VVSVTSVVDLETAHDSSSDDGDSGYAEHVESKLPIRPIRSVATRPNGPGVGSRMWSAGKIVALAGALVATYFVFAAGAVRIALRAREVTVPDLTSHTTSEASAMTAPLGLTLREDELRRPDAKIGAGRIITQDPAAGSVARRARTIRVWLSAGQRAAIVPALTGETERAAQLRLSQNGLALSSISEIRSYAYPADVVVAQQPAAQVAGSSVTLLVNRGAPAATYVMPDLIGVSGDRAAEVLRARGFRVAVVGSNPYPGISPGVVIRQNPQAGYQIAPGEPISLEVSR
jgi:eukaryotic-like serine/threonine-protein kinase